MARAKANKLYRTFVKGMVTEASPLTYPENASTDELNTVLSRKGNRARRRGLDYERNYVLNPVLTYLPGDTVTEYVWHSVAKIADKKFVAVQLGKEVHFWNVDETPTSDNKHPYVLDLLDFKSETSAADDIRKKPVCFSSGAGFLFIAHPLCDPIVVEYNKTDDTFTAIRVVIQIRDFEGVYDALANDEEPATLSKEHEYNLMNQGWVDPGQAAGGGGGTGGGGGGTYYDPYTGQPREYTKFPDNSEEP